MKKKLETRPTGIRVPKYMAQQRNELHILWNLLREATTIQVYGILVMESDFKTGEFLSTYNNIIELCTPPVPERGKRMEGPTMAQVRRAIDQLVTFDLVRRDAFKNAAQGQLRLQVVAPRLKPELPPPLKEPITDKTIRQLKLGSTRINPDSPMDDEPLPTAGESAPVCAPAAARPAAAQAQPDAERKLASKATREAALRKYHESQGTTLEAAKAKLAKPKKTPVPRQPAGVGKFVGIGEVLEKAL